MIVTVLTWMGIGIAFLVTVILIVPIRILSSFVRAVFLRGYLAGKIGLADLADTALIGMLGRLLQIQTKRSNLSLPKCVALCFFQPN